MHDNLFMIHAVIDIYNHHYCTTSPENVITGKIIINTIRSLLLLAREEVVISLFA